MPPIFRHLRNYLSAGLIGSLLGLVSFPLMTRSLSVEDYGLLGLVSATVTIFVSFAKLGLQNAIIRFFSEARNRGAPAFQKLLDNIAGISVLLSVVGVLLWWLYAQLVIPLIDDTPLLRWLFLLATALIPLKVIQSLLANLLQADERSGTLSTVTVFEKVFRLLCMIGIVLSVGLSSERALIVIIISEALLLMVLLYCCGRYLSSTRMNLNWAVLTPLVAYGFPAMIGELTAVLLETGDRYVIQGFLGSESLGQYAAAVNICMYLEWVLILALQSAIVPHYVKLYEEQGRAATIAFLNKSFEIYVAVALGVFVVFCVAAPDLIIILAGEKYRGGLVVIPWFAAAYVLVGAISIAAAGVFIDKRTILLVKWTGAAFVINMILNIMTVPHFGLTAAAIATFIAMSIRTLGVRYDACKTLPVDIPWKALTQSVACAIPALLLGYWVNSGSLLIDLFASATVSGVIYIALILTINPYMRNTVLERAKRVMGSNTA